MILAGRHIPLSRVGLDIVAALADAKGGTVSRQELQSALPRSVSNTHAVEVAIARLRETIGVPDVIKTVVKRGYRLDVVDEDLRDEDLRDEESN